jgi:hypothetical protein
VLTVAGDAPGPAGECAAAGCYGAALPGVTLRAGGLAWAGGCPKGLMDR